MNDDIYQHREPPSFARWTSMLFPIPLHVVFFSRFTIDTSGWRRAILIFTSTVFHQGDKDERRSLSRHLSLQVRGILYCSTPKKVGKINFVFREKGTPNSPNVIFRGDWTGKLNFTPYWNINETVVMLSFVKSILSLWWNLHGLNNESIQDEEKLCASFRFLTASSSGLD